MEAMSRLLGGESGGSSGSSSNKGGFLSDLDESFTLSRTTRIYGFIGCFVGGFLLSILSVIAVAFGNIGLFAILYSVGNILSICSTGFLVGPVKQIKNMFKETRYIATIVMLVCIGLTLWAAIGLKNTLLVIIFCILEFLAMAWYCLSYIPFARNAVKGCLGGIFED